MMKVMISPTAHPHANFCVLLRHQEVFEHWGMQSVQKGPKSIVLSFPNLAAKKGYPE
jgi:hypothetical protein